MTTTKKFLGTFVLAMIAVAAIIDLRGLPMMASYGLSMIVVYGVAALLFLIPSGLVCAELATQIQAPGGIYAWIRQAFGEKAGFLSIWLEWLNNVIGFPASLTFMAVALAYVIHPGLAQNKLWVLLCTLTMLWAVTLFTLCGVKASSRLNFVGALVGTILPAGIIIVLSALWVFTKHKTQITYQFSNLMPSWQHINPGLFAALTLGFGGMQIVAFHRENVQYPARTYPRAIALAVFFIVAIAVFTSLAIATVVPQTELNVVTGLIESYHRFLQAFGMPWATSFLVLLMILSLFATLNAWFLGPARGLVVAVDAGYLPEWLGVRNRADIPKNIILLQGMVGTLLSLVFWYMPDISSGFWVLLNLSSQSALLVYIFIFLSAIKLRQERIHPATEGFTIPGGKTMLGFVAGVGAITCIIALMTSVIPPTVVNTGSVLQYELILLCSNAIFISLPFIIFALSSRKLALAEEI